MKPEQIEEGINHISQLVDDIARNGSFLAVSSLQLFRTYLKSYWLPLSEIMSIYYDHTEVRNADDCRPASSNNTCETFHFEAHTLMGDHPKPWTYLGIIKTYEYNCIRK